MGNDTNKYSKSQMRVLNQFRLLNDLRITDTINNPVFRNLWQLGNCLLDDGKYADEYQAKLDVMLTPIRLAQGFMPPRPLKMPKVSANDGILIGTEVGTNRPIIIHKNSLAHTLEAGSTNMGKSRLQYVLVSQLRGPSQKNAAGVCVNCRIMDMKGESGTLINLFPEDVAVFRPDQLPHNILQPKGPARAYFRGLIEVIRHYRNLRVETAGDIPGVLLRMNRSRKHDAPAPSLVDLERQLRRLADAEDRPNLRSAAQGISVLIDLLGASARIRKGYSINKPIEIIRFDGLDKRSADLLLGLLLVVDVAFADSPPMSDRRLRTAYFLEDATTIIAEGPGGSDISQSPLIYAFLNASWLGAAIIACVHSLIAIPNIILNNVKTFIVFRCPSPTEAKVAASILHGRPELSEKIQNLPPRHFYIWSDGFEGPVLGKTPEIETGTRPTEQEIDERMRPYFEKINSNLVLSPEFEDENIAPISYLDDDAEEPQTESPTNETTIAETPEVVALYVRFLSVVAANSCGSTRELNACLGLSTGKATRIKTLLEEQGFISTRREAGTTGRPRLVIQIEPKGMQFLEKWGGE